MVPLEAQYPGVYIDTFIFFLRSLYKIIWMNVHYFPNAPRINHFKSDLINSMDQMRILGTEPSSVILSQTE